MSVSPTEAPALARDTAASAAVSSNEPALAAERAGAVGRPDALALAGERATAVGRPDSAVDVAVVDYGAGNLVSVTHALEQLGARVRLARRPGDLADAAGIVVPGVGASGPAMARLRRMGMPGALRDTVDAGAFYLGICLGMQLLFERSDEDGTRGLGWLAGPVRLIPDAPRLPHIGWNEVDVEPVPLFADIRPGTPFYFVHSYAPVPADAGVVAGTTEHGGRFVSAVSSGRLHGVQFHPEKSGTAGLMLLRNFLGLAAAGRARADMLVPGDSPRTAPPIRSAGPAVQGGTVATDLRTA